MLLNDVWLLTQFMKILFEDKKKPVLKNTGFYARNLGGRIPISSSGFAFFSAAYHSLSYLNNASVRLLRYIPHNVWFSFAIKKERKYKTQINIRSFFWSFPPLYKTKRKILPKVKYKKISFFLIYETPLFKKL